MGELKRWKYPTYMHQKETRQNNSDIKLIDNMAVVQ